jgi:DNA polymerase zeta
MYESADQETPVYEAKGIETVRRDGCPAVSKVGAPVRSDQCLTSVCLQVLEKSLRLLFETQDVSLVKQYVTKQFQKILMGRVNLQDLVFAKEFRGFKGYKPGACVPALELARYLIL